MSIEKISHQLPESAKDIKLNWQTILTENGAPDLSMSQIAGIALSVGYALKNTSIIEAILAEFSSTLTADDIKGAQSSANIMAMNNIYYRFVHLSQDKSFATLPAKLRMNIIANPGIAKVNFELNCLGVSILNGCGMCIDAHTLELTKAGVSKLGIQSCARISAVVHAVSVAL